MCCRLAGVVLLNQWLTWSQGQRIGKSIARDGKIVDGRRWQLVQHSRLHWHRHNHWQLCEAHRITNSWGLNQALWKLRVHLPGHLRRKAVYLCFIRKRKVAHAGCQTFTEHDERGRIQATIVNSAGLCSCARGPWPLPRVALTTGLGRRSRGLTLPWKSAENHVHDSAL